MKSIFRMLYSENAGYKTVINIFFLINNIKFIPQPHFQMKSGTWMGVKLIYDQFITQFMFIYDQFMFVWCVITASHKSKKFNLNVI